MSNQDKIKKAVSITIGVGVLTWYLWLAFSHPDMTPTRLLLTFWKQYLIGAGLCIVAIVIQLTKGEL